MKKLLDSLFIILLIFWGSTVLHAQPGGISPYISYPFTNNQVKDEPGNSQLFLRKGANLVNDSERGTVLRFKASEKSYAVFNKQFLKSDTCTFSFYFFWEDAGATNWHQLLELFNFKTQSNIFLCSSNSWDNKFSFLSDCREFKSYEGVYGQILPRNKWVHLAMTLKNKDCRLYIDGVEAGRNTLMFTPSVVKGDSLFLAGNPYRSDNFYITAKYDDIKYFSEALTSNQIKAVANGNAILPDKEYSTSWEPTGNPIELTIDLTNRKQTIQNFGSSDGWNTEIIGKYWPESKKEKLAELIFSAEKDASGNPKGIGLSSWRFNIGAGTAEQGEASRISHESRRTEGFLNADGTYNWEKQKGQQWFLKKAATTYNINHIIGWQNSPPVPYTKGNLGFREFGSPMETILKSEYFDDFGRFLAVVSEHFDKEGIHLDYISPLNEPQYPWSPDQSGGTVSQEGTPWTNQNIFDVVSAIHTEFAKRNVSTKLFITEAGTISHLLKGTGPSENQLYKFWNSNSSTYLSSKSSFAPIVSYHSYWNDYGNLMINERTELFNRAQQLYPVPELWQTEYSFMGNGYRYGYPSTHKLSEIECALPLARIIMADLNFANTTAWQWWTTFEQGKFEGETRFTLIEAFTNKEKTDGAYHLNKLFYGFGNFSHFIRPGMIRLGTSRADNVSTLDETNTVMFSAYTNKEENKMVLVALNQTNEAKQFTINLKNSGNKSVKNSLLFLTDDFNNLAKQDRNWADGKFVIPAKSIVTITADLSIGTSVFNTEAKPDDYKAFYDGSSDQIRIEAIGDNSISSVQLFSLSGMKLYHQDKTGSTSLAQIPASGLVNGVYLIYLKGKTGRYTQKVVVSRNDKN
ncbi:MAG: T9SS type A sorting domain-containing protein [Prolixibacteraceae bacterium]|nr:T9SS type A sorting domain-containing protein [Prolixibacteraceae bacterium]